MWFIHFKKFVIDIFLVWFLLLIIQMGVRFYLFIAYASTGIYSDYGNDIFKMFMVGGLLDIRIASIISAILFVLAAFLAVSANGFSTWRKIYPGLSAFCVTLVAFLSVVNVYYYETYERAIDVFIFGLIDDDTVDILSTMWQDYPVIPGLIVLAIFAFLIYRLFKLWGARNSRRVFKSGGKFTATSSTVVVCALIFVGMRGSIGTFPLRQSDTQVSDVKLLNMLTPNAVLALDWAYKDYKRSNRFEPAPDSDGRVLLTSFFGTPTKPDLSAFMATSRPNPIAKEKPPHVVLAVMESMGEHLLSFDNADRDLFGELRSHWNEDIVFKRFVSEGDGTIDSLSRLLIHSPMDRISQSTAQFVDFKSNMLKPYLNNGYKVIFVTSGNGSWRNLNEFLPNLGVTEFVEENKLKSLYPEAQVSTWGIPDEFMFNYIQQRLSDADKAGEHLFIIALSTTHHPPYHVPKGYSTPKFTFSPQESQRLSHLGNGRDLTDIFGTLRYVNDRLGLFIDWVKGSSLKDHTIIAITGDHNIRGIGYPDPSEQVLGHAVPFYLYVPKSYLIDTYYDELRAGSHKDIWPTLYNLSLSDSRYYQTGCDLLAKENSGPWCFGYNPNVIFDQFGAYSTDSFRPWVSSVPGELLLGDVKPMTAEQERELFRRQGITPLLKWQLNRQVQEAK